MALISVLCFSLEDNGLFGTVWAGSGGAGLKSRDTVSRTWAITG